MAFSFPNTIPAIIIFIVCSIFQTNAQISTPCTSSMLKTFTPCLNYVTNSSGTSSSPTQDCCDSLKSLMADSVDCACLVVTGNVPVSMPFVNRNLAISLPKLCHNSVPVQCKASGDPLPAPGPALFGPTLAPTASSAAHSHSHSPKASKAPAESTDVESESPPEFSLGPSANPGIRPVVNPKSDSNPTTISLLYVVLMSIGIMANKLFC